MTPNLLTIPAIFVIAGVGLLIVAIIGELSIKEIRVPPLPRTGRILAALAGIVFIGLGTSWPRDTTPPQAGSSSNEGAREQALINGPAEGATVPLKTVVTGTLRDALPPPVSYWLLLQDDGGDYYPVRRIAVQQNGAWEEPITFGPAWRGRTARILLVQATSEDPLLSAATDSGDALHTLPVGLRTITTRHLRVQTP
jgi:hypothetical protein